MGPAQRLEPWTAPQRAVLIALCLGLLVYLSIRLWLHPAHLTRPPPDEAARSRELADRIDPNTADWTALAALPMLGEHRARQIVAHREQMLKKSTGQVVFQSADDLQQVPGIGPAIAESIAPYLIFPAESGSRPNAQ